MEKQLQISRLLNQTSQRVQKFVDGIRATCQQPGRTTNHVERRGRERLEVTMPIWVTPLNDELEPLGTRCKGITRDVSLTGAGLAVSRSVRSNFVLLEFVSSPNETFGIISKLTYCRRDGGFFRAGCEFMICETLESRREQQTQKAVVTSCQINLLDVSTGIGSTEARP